MITKDDIRTFKNYPVVLILLEDIFDKHKRKSILKIIEKYNRCLKLVHNNVIDKETKQYLFELVKEDYKTRLNDSKFTVREGERLNGYFMAKWREYIRLNEINLPIRKLDSGRIKKCVNKLEEGYTK